MLEGGKGGKKRLADVRLTMAAARSQKHFIYVWMAAGVQFCLAHMAYCGLWHLFASLLSPHNELPPSQTHTSTQTYMCGGACGVYARIHPPACFFDLEF